MTNFIDAIKMLYMRYVDFEGRSSRSEYWWVQLLLLFVAIIFLIFVYPWIVTTSPEKPPVSFFIAAIGLAVFVLISFLPLVSLSVRRLHDLNESGWVLLGAIVLSLIPFIEILVGLGLLIIFCMRGTNGPNKFGADPLGDQ